jgi:hypothetical protein
MTEPTREQLQAAIGRELGLPSGLHGRIRGRTVEEMIGDAIELGGTTLDDGARADLVVRARTMRPPLSG